MGDVNQSNTLGLRGAQDPTMAAIQFGTTGATFGYNSTSSVWYLAGGSGLSISTPANGAGQIRINTTTGDGGRINFQNAGTSTYTLYADVSNFNIYSSAAGKNVAQFQQNSITFNNPLTVNSTIDVGGSTVWHAGNFEPNGKANLSGADFTGYVRMQRNTGKLVQDGNNGSSIEITGDGTATGGAFLTLHRPGAYATRFGLNENNELAFGGWSEGTGQYKLWTAKNFDPYNLTTPSSITDYSGAPVTTTYLRRMLGQDVGINFKPFQERILIDKTHAGAAQGAFDIQVYTRPGDIVGQDGTKTGGAYSVTSIINTDTKYGHFNFVAKAINNSTYNANTDPFFFGHVAACLYADQNKVDATPCWAAALETKETHGLPNPTNGSLALEATVIASGTDNNNKRCLIFLPFNIYGNQNTYTEFAQGLYFKTANPNIFVKDAMLFQGRYGNIMKLDGTNLNSIIKATGNTNEEAIQLHLLSSVRNSHAITINAAHAYAFKDANSNTVGAIGYGSGRITTTVPMAANGYVLPGRGNNTITSGTGDGASYSTYNIIFQSHWGIGMATYDGKVYGYYDSRGAFWDTKGVPRVNGQNVWYPGNFDPNSKATVGAYTVNRFGGMLISDGQGYIYGDAGQNNVVIRTGDNSSSKPFKYAIFDNSGGLALQGGLYAATDINANGNLIAGQRVIVGAGQPNSYIEMRDTDEGTRYIHNNSGAIGFLNNNGNWGLRVQDDGDFWTPKMGWWRDVKATIDSKAIYDQPTFGGRLWVWGGTNYGNIEPYLSLYNGGVRHWRITARNNAELKFEDGNDGTVNFAFRPDGSFYSSQTGNLYEFTKNVRLAYNGDYFRADSRANQTFFEPIGGGVVTGFRGDVNGVFDALRVRQIQKQDGLNNWYGVAYV